MTRPLLPAATLAIGALLLAGCSTPAPEEPSAAAPVETPTPEPQETTATGPDCLIGDWFIAQDQMQAFYDAVGGSSGATMTVEGGTGLSFAETGYTYTPQFALLVDVAGSQGRGTITGGVTGDYTADDTTITTSHDSSDITLSIEVAGTVVDGSGLFGEILAGSPINSAPYECTADGPLIQFDAGSDRVPVQLAAR